MTANITTRSLLLRSASAWQRLRFGWQDYQAVLRLLDRQHDLESLVRWAERKKIGPYYYYLSLLRDTERQLFRRRLQAPWAAAWARSLYTISRFVFPPPRQRKKGAAAQYRCNPLRRDSLIWKGAC